MIAEHMMESWTNRQFIRRLVTSTSEFNNIISHCEHMLRDVTPRAEGTEGVSYFGYCLDWESGPLIYFMSS